MLIRKLTQQVTKINKNESMLVRHSTKAAVKDTVLVLFAQEAKQVWS